MCTRALTAGLAMLLLAACEPESTSPVEVVRPAQSLVALATVSGAITGPGGASICDLVTGSVRVALASPSRVNQLIAFQTICTGSNTYALAAAPGTYFLQVRPQPSPALGSLPWRFYDPTPVVLGADVVRDVQVQNGAPLGGGATLDGGPVAGMGLSVTYGLLPGFTAATATSSAAGGWSEDGVGRNPPILQTGLAYLFTGCQGGPLAANMISSPLPSSPVLFPTSFASVSCDFASNTASDRTHFSGRLVVTADAGEFGAQDPSHAALRGRGWGVQFPVGASGPVHLPPNATQLFTGGLIFGFAPEKVLSAVDLTGYSPCALPCMDFDISGSPSVAPRSTGKVVTWRYSDAVSSEREGLQVAQRSFDGNGDYVLFQFVIRNTSAEAKTFWAGTFMDWDLDLDPQDDGVETALDGRLMYSYSGLGYLLPRFPRGNHLGSMLLGQPVSGNYAYAGAGGTVPTLGEQVAALSGALSAPSDVRPSLDKRYLHGAGPITLQPGHQTDLWVPIVAGADKVELLAAAAAAEADWQQHGQRLTVGIDVLPGSSTNQINLKNNGLVPVAILGGAGFNVRDIDVTTLVFGPGGAVPAHNLSDPAVLASHLQDVNSDGYLDLMTHYSQPAIGLTAGTTQACVNGVTKAGIVFDGCDAVRVK